MVFTELKSILNLLGQADEQLEYWREYKGQEVVIREHTIDRIQTDERLETPIQQTSFLIQGTIDEVMSFPPGFRLVDVKESVVNDDYVEKYTTEPPVLSYYSQGSYTLREVDSKFVSFNAIEELEWAKDAEEAVFPVRDGEQ